MHPIYTIGHSTRGIGEFIDLLKEHGIQLLVDVRRYPGSRRFPQFNQGELEQSLNEVGIDYRHKKILGGRRGKPDSDSPNKGWRSDGFQAYADHLSTKQVRQEIDNLIETAEETTLALMCAEAVYWRCHRQLIADWLDARGLEVIHILGPDQTQQHELNEMAEVQVEGTVIYPEQNEDPTDQQKLFGD
ncbi:MAG: DUF488 domain-containing protein [Balneolaceae bacterium]|nr:DUF488 domain-containing protein [Balneolaceae bacterium]